MRSTDAAVIILNFNGSRDTLACLESLSEGSGLRHEIIVVDNGSKDSSVPRLQSWAMKKNIPILSSGYPADRGYASETSLPRSVWPKLSMIQTGANLGFAEGNNIGIKYALKRDVEYIMLLNNDTVVPPGVVSHLVQTAKQENAGIVGACICYFDEPERVWFTGGEFRWWNDRMIQSVSVRLKSSDSIIETDWVTGCCMLVHRRVFDEIGLLDENAFLYGEDVDFCLRAAQAGIRRVVTLRATIYHKVSRSSGADTPFTWYHYTRSRLYFHRKHHSKFSHLLFLIAFLPTRFGRSLGWMLYGRLDLIRATWLAVLDAYRVPSELMQRFRPAAETEGRL